MTAVVEASVVPAPEQARIRATVARHYRMARQFQPMLTAVISERNGWANCVVAQYLDDGTPDPTMVFYYLVAAEYVEAAQRLTERRRARLAAA